MNGNNRENDNLNTENTSNIKENIDLKQISFDDIGSEDKTVSDEDSKNNEYKPSENIELNQSNHNKEQSNIKGTSLIKVALISTITSIVATTAITIPIINKANSNSINMVIDDSSTNNVYKAVAQKGTPSVVGITTKTVSTNNLFNIPTQSEGIGSGVIVHKKGYILTNSHVINDGKATEVSVMFSDGDSSKGKVLWHDSRLDLAVVKVPKSNLTVAELGDSDKVQVGDLAIAIGNPLGLEFNKTVTQGIISGLDRVIKTEKGDMTDLIQTDASINPGNSGGPLLNSKGQVIGINTAKASGAEGLGFSIPINVAKPIIEQVIKKGSFEKVTLGLKGIDVEMLDLSVSKGVYVVEVEDSTPAKKYGLRSGDIITSINNKDISNMSDLTKFLYNLKKGDKISISIHRNGDKQNIDVIL